MSGFERLGFGEKERASLQLPGHLQHEGDKDDAPCLLQTSVPAVVMSKRDGILPHSCGFQRVVRP